MTGHNGLETLDIFNHYVEHSFAACFPEPLPDAKASFFPELSGAYPAFVARTADGLLAGFGLLRPCSPLRTFAGIAELTLFVRGGCTGSSSRNEGSLRFHLRNGFAECGRFRDAGEKFGQRSDVVYCQMLL